MTKPTRNSMKNSNCMTTQRATKCRRKSVARAQGAVPVRSRSSAGTTRHRRGSTAGWLSAFGGQERKISASRAEETTMGIASPVSQGLGAERGAAKGGLAGLRPPRRQEKRRQGRQEASRVSRPAAAHDLNNAPQEESHLREPLPIQASKKSRKATESSTDAGVMLLALRHWRSGGSVRERLLSRAG